jgi:hypothetical protein
MLTAAAGVPFDALVFDAPAGQLGSITIDVYNPTTGRSVVAPTTEGITEPHPGNYRVPLTIQVAGSYVVRWTIPGLGAAKEPLVVTEPLPTQEFAPTADDVAAVVPAYTRGGFDDDGPQAGAEQGVFTTTTSPTKAHVEALITAASAEVAGRVAVPIPARFWGLARRTVIWNVAASISAGKLPAGTDEASGEYRAHIASYTACLNELVQLARAPGAMRLT